MRAYSALQDKNGVEIAGGGGGGGGGPVAGADVTMNDLYNGQASNVAAILQRVSDYAWPRFNAGLFAGDNPADANHFLTWINQSDPRADSYTMPQDNASFGENGIRVLWFRITNPQGSLKILGAGGVTIQDDWGGGLLFGMGTIAVLEWNGPNTWRLTRLAQGLAKDRRRMELIEEEFLMANANAFDNMLGTAISSGTIAVVAGTKDHPGVIALRDSTTANGGYRIMTDTTAILLSGGEKATFTFQNKGIRAGASYRMGFHDSTAIQTAPTDGVYFDVVSGVVSAKTRNNGVQSVSLSWDPGVNIWYTATIELNADASMATFKVVDDAGNQTMLETISTNIPKTTGRGTGFGIIAGETSTDAAADICWIDYMCLEVNRPLAR